MKKKLVVLFLCVISFAAGIVFASNITSSSAATDLINRSPDIIYPDDEYEWERTAFIYVQSNDKYYHDWKYDCDFANHENIYSPIEVSIYEAVERGYAPCPNCFRPEMEISPYQWSKMLKER